MKQLEVKIAENKKLSQDFYKMRLESAYLAKCSKPGQFVEIKCSKGHEVLLRRPFSLHKILDSGIEVLYEVVGKGTELLSQKKPGEILDIIGPLGNGFSIKRTTNDERRTTILIAGGMGVAPLIALAENLAHRKNPKISVLIGAKTRNHILCENDFKKIGCEVLISTEDGSRGYKGLVTSLLRNTIHDSRTTIYACGPHPMLKAVSHVACSSDIPCQVSMEEHMACGVGVCLGCPVKVYKNPIQYSVHNTQYQYKMVCKDGPVFDAKEIAW